MIHIKNIISDSMDAKLGGSKETLQIIKDVAGTKSYVRGGGDALTYIYRIFGT